MPYFLPRLFRLLSLLPLDALHRLGALLGWLAYLLSGTYRQHLQTNLQRGIGTVSGAIRRGAIAAAGEQVLELPKIWLRPLDEVAGRVARVSGWEHVEAAWANDQGIVFLTPHLGCFEITAQYYAARCPIERPITVLYRQPKQAWLGELIEAGRQRSERLLLAPADLSGVRRLIGGLRKHQAVGLLPDQVPGVGEGRWLPFFDQPDYTMTLAARLSEVSSSVVIFAWAERLPFGAGYHLHLSSPTQPLTGDTLERAAAINRELEHLIRQCPAQYLWGYNRYKRPRGAEPPPAPPAA